MKSKATDGSNPLAASLLRLSKRLMKSGLSIPQYCLLGQLPRIGKGVTMTILARAMECTNAGITGLADRLEQGGFVRRDLDSSDRRLIVLSLTAKGLGTLNTFETQGLA